MKQTDKSILCLVDAGNTSIKLSLVRGKRQTFRRFESLSSALAFFRHLNADTAVLSSVRDSKSTQTLSTCLKKISRNFFTAREASLPLFKSRYDLEQLGEDRISALSHALLNHLAPCVIVDAGTAITIDFLNRPNLFLGGYICAGFQTEWKTLAMKTALLPRIKIATLIKERRLPVNTQEALSSGVIRVKSEGIAALISGHIQRMKSPPSSWNILISGGDAEILKSSSLFPQAEIIPEIVLKGLKSLALCSLL